MCIKWVHVEKMRALCVYMLRGCLCVFRRYVCVMRRYDMLCDEKI